MAKKPNRPRRAQKGDRLLSPGARKDEIMCDYALAPFDRLATEMDMFWGIERLPELVSPETAQKYGAAIAHLNECIEQAKPDECRAAAENCIKGMQVMDAEARANGATPASGDYWEYEVDGFRFAVMRDGREWQTASAARPDLRFFTLREVGVALQALRLDNPIFAEVTKHFPKAQITSIAERVTGDDPIPFGDPT
nr:hypothetical protein [uncultured Roseovarius sp.]